MNVVYMSGIPRKNSNTDYLLKCSLFITGGEFVKLSDYQIQPCKSCWTCLKLNRCIIDDDMSNVLIPPMLLKCDAIVLGSPVYFNNVSDQIKAFIDRT